MEQTGALRAAIQQRMKQALKNADKITLSTTRLVLAAIKDRDIAARGKGREGISDDDIFRLLVTMIKQRRESIASYEQAGRKDMVEQEKREIEIIATFLPPPLEAGELEDICARLMEELHITGMKDMGRLMNELKSRYPGRLDPSEASAILRRRLQ